MFLTDAKVRSLKTRETQYKVSDSEGLYLLVSPSGGKLWRLAYRFHGKQKSLALGRYAPEPRSVRSFAGMSAIGAKRTLR